MNLNEFLQTYVSDEVPLTHIEVPTMSKQTPHPMVIVRYGSHVAILSLMGLKDHLCIDVHPFVDGEDATAAAFGISNGVRTLLRGESNKEPETKSHGWPSASMVAVVIGLQERSKSQ